MPRYPVAGGDVELGYEPLVGEVAARVAKVVAVDGPPAVPWDELLPALVAALERAGLSVALVDLRAFYRPWDEIERLTDDARLAHDPVFARLPAVRLGELLGPLPEPSTRGVTVVAGPGAALVGHDLLWYADMPKALALARLRDGLVANLGQQGGEAGSERRLLYLDWPILDDHAASIVGRLDRLIDASDVHEPRSLTGEALCASLRALAGRPFRTRPTFLPGAWGGQWLRRELGIETDAANLAWSYELITPESGILLGDDRPVEVGFDLLLASQGDRVLGASVRERFGRSFPIRFDYLDTLEGGHLSVQCHPRDAYAREVFGLDYTQHETYYVMATTPGASVFLGLEGDADLASFREDAERAARDGVGFEPERYVRRHEAREHQLYLIPAGTVHASGAGNVVLEISATPYLYTLRFYDWLRRDLEGELRPVHVDHAFANLDPGRRGDALAELVPEPRVLRAGPGWAELELGRHPDLFFRVNRLELEDAIADEMDGRFHVLNLVEGGAVQIETDAGDVQRLSYAETVVIPAAVGRYEVRPLEGTACKLVKAFVA